MKKLSISLLFVFLTTLTFSQFHALAKQWDKRFGGTLSDEMYSCIQTADGGYLLGGASFSGIGGDKTQNNWDTTYSYYDFWVVKIDSNGNKEWDKRFGGIFDEGIETYSLAQTSDGGYLLVGNGGGVGGDITQIGRGGADYWVVKIDPLGNKQWDRRFGGPNDDLLFAMQFTKDQNALLGGTSYSGVGGDKTQPSWGGTDYWVVKMDSIGNELWDKRYGGNQYEFLYALCGSNDGGYLLGGISSSDSSGDKTQPNWRSGYYNVWIVKIDSLGNKQWDKRFGGTGSDGLKSLIQTKDGNFLLGCSSSSQISGNKSQNSINGSADYWIVKIDTEGNKLWDKDYGGSASDELISLSLTLDGGFLLAGNSYSLASGDKTENNTGGPNSFQTWVIKTDSNGNKQWDKTIFLNGSSLQGSAFQTKDSCYVISNYNGAEIGYYKTQPSWDSTSDYWIVKFCDTVLFTNLTPITDTYQFSIYPNPFTTDLNINIQNQNLHTATFTITNPLGQTIYTQQENNLSPNYTKMLDLSYLPNGVYFVAVSVNGERVVREVVKE